MAQDRKDDGDGLTSAERDDIEDRKSGSAKVLHEVIREQGDAELDRPLVSLLLSGLAAGVAMSFSLLAEGFLQSRLPDAPWRLLVVGFGYTVGFLIVVLGRMQLFTESTVSAVLPVAAEPTARNFVRLLRLWGAVFLANLVGTFAVAWLASRSLIIDPEQSEAVLAIARESLGHGGLETALLAAPAGFLVASLAWVLPNARGNEVSVVVAITYVMAIGGFGHVVAGSTRAWVLWLNEATTLKHAIAGLILPTLVGNIVGGTGLFALLAHGQVRHELNGSGAND